MDAMMTKKQDADDLAGQRGGGARTTSSGWVERSVKKVNLSSKPSVIATFENLCISLGEKQSRTFAAMVKFCDARRKEFIEENK